MTTVPSQEETVPDTIKHSQHLVVVPIDMLAAAIDSSSKAFQTEKSAELLRCFQNVFVSAKYLQCIAAQQKQRVSLKFRIKTTLPTSGPAD